MMPRQPPLDLAARRLGQAAGADQDNLADGNIMLPRNRLADRRADLSSIGLSSEGAYNFLHDYQLLLAASVGHAECSAAVAAQRGVPILNRRLDVLWVMVDAADDDQVLDPPGNVKLAVVRDKTEIARAQPIASAARRESCPEHGLGRLRVAPIAASDMRPRDPD